MVKAPGTFQVGVAGGPVRTGDLHEVMYTERSMDTPEENPKLCHRCPAGQVHGPEGELLLIHGCRTTWCCLSTATAF